MAISKEQLAKIINHNANTLCSKSGQEKIRQYAGAIDTNSLNNDMVSDEWDNWNFDDTASNKKTVSSMQPISENSLRNSKLPDAIKESFAKQPPMDGSDSTSFLDDVAAQRQSTGGRNYFNQDKLNEINIPQPSYTTIPQPQYQPVGIDYNYLKHIIGECISEYFSKQSLNESTTLKQIGLYEGKIRLVDNKGNIYGADLEFKGNVNDKKKK